MDASALVKAFLVEDGRELVLDLLTDPEPATTSRISYVECHAAFARTRRERRITPRKLSQLTTQFEQRWVALVALELDASIAQEAARLAHEHAVRSFDAIHLASAGALAAPEETSFACWDSRLWEAASASGFRMVPEELPG